MIDKSALENAKKQLKKHNQSHLLAFWEQINDNQRQNLLKQINQLDFTKIDNWVANYILRTSKPFVPECFGSAVPSYSPFPTSLQLQKKYDKALETGKKLISAGKVAAFVVAGGQGTRLGFDGPKGNLKISPVKNKTLFQLFAESITAVSKRYNTTCPWYIMASPLNYSDIKETFRANNYYGLEQDSVFVFQQGTLPNFDFDGKILLAEKDSLACSPDGHGGSLKALYESCAVVDMKKRGIELISYFQVDNPLINIFDPLFIGLHTIDQAEMSSKALTKTGPMEKVGNFCLINGKITVVEYSNLPDELAQKQNPDGSLVFELGNTAIHIINRTFVEKLNAGGFSIPLHKAVKKIPYTSRQGDLIEPEQPNGVKLESFVFDALALASKSIILRTLRNEEFAPVKNATGTDSIETAKEMMIDRAANWLESANVTIPRGPDGRVDCIIEIAPSFALGKEDIKTKLNQIPKIKVGDRIYLA